MFYLIIFIILFCVFMWFEKLRYNYYNGVIALLNDIHKAVQTKNYDHINITYEYHLRYIIEKCSFIVNYKNKKDLFDNLYEIITHKDRVFLLFSWGYVKTCQDKGYSHQINGID